MEKRWWILIVILVGVLILILILININHKENLNKISLNSEQNNITDICDYSLQSSSNDKFNFNKLNIISYNDIENKNSNYLVGRILNDNPLTFEVIDSNTLNYEYPIDIVRVNNDIEKESVTNLTKLKFKDFFRTKLGYITDTSGPELGMSTLLESLEGLDDYSINRTLLIEYVPKSSNTNEFLIIFSNGEVIYKDNVNNVMVKTIEKEELINLLKIFRDNYFNSKKSTDYSREPSITLSCNRFQHVILDQSDNDLKIITEALDRIIMEIKDKSQYSIVYQKSIKLNIINWPIKNISLDKINNYHQEMVKNYNSSHIIYEKIPQDLVDELPISPPVDNDKNRYNYFSDNGKLYYVTMGECMPNIQLCKSGTFYTVSSKEVVEPSGETFGFGIKLWPDKLGIKLNKNINETKLSKEEFSKNEDFYNIFFKYESGDKRFIQDGYLYEDVDIKID